MAEKKVQKNKKKVARSSESVAKKKQTKLEAPVYGMDGKKKSTVKLPETIFNAQNNNDLVHQVVESMLANARQPIAHTKDRSEVRGGGRKPWRQKGTGRARHGSRRSPIWVGGGVTHGPRKERVWSKKINKKMRRSALYAVLSQKHRDGEILFVDTLSLSEPKTRQAKEALNTLAGISGYEKLVSKKNNTALIALAEDNKELKRAFANLGNVAVDEIRNLNPVSLLTYTYVIIASPEDSIAWLANRGTKGMNPDSVRGRSQKNKTKTMKSKPENIKNNKKVAG